MIRRKIKKTFLQSLQFYPITIVTGPRQSGKTTFLKDVLPDWKYVSLEDPDIREFCKTDPRGFLSSFSERSIIDEAQRVPELFSYLQTKTDKTGDSGQYVLSGSQNFQLMKSISQSLAGRCSVLKLMPFSQTELQEANLLHKNVYDYIYTGGYPRIYDKHIPPARYYADYFETYVQRDIRNVENIGDLQLFTKFIKLCAGRIGQLVNITSLANDCGISATTATRWLALLETSFIIYKLKPDFRNFTKRLTKMPKIYFTDTGLASYLLGLKSGEQLSTHYLRGNLFENMIINGFVCNEYNRGFEPDFSYWRDKTGLEIDLLKTSLTQEGKEIIEAYEIKSGETMSSDYFSNMEKWAKFPGNTNNTKTLIYAGEQSFTTQYGKVMSWNNPLYL
ncbi:ATP-binding protein [Treponema sp. OMZ 840]|uniref:ATP-binding protein n=1 Tax=Treponema sp. OMZ 840 TaxID=244313 RepID=UPI003D8C89BD